MIMTSHKRQLEKDDFDFKRKRGLSGISTREEFTKTYPGYHVDSTSILEEPADWMQQVSAK